MDDIELKHHFIQQILDHDAGIDQETLIQKTAQSAQVESHKHRESILDWINFLVSTGHLKRDGESITAEEASRLEFIHMVKERRRDWQYVGSSPQLTQFFRY